MILEASYVTLTMGGKPGTAPNLLRSEWQVHLAITLFTYLLTPWCRVLLEKLTGLQLVKKFPAFHGNRRFITALTSVCHLSILGQPNPVHIPTSHLLEIQPNIIHPSMPRSPQWSPSLRFPQQDPPSPTLRNHPSTRQDLKAKTL